MPRIQAMPTPTIESQKGDAQQQGRRNESKEGMKRRRLMWNGQVHWEGGNYPAQEDAPAAIRYSCAIVERVRGIQNRHWLVPVRHIFT
jgi:hypothetical protein